MRIKCPNCGGVMFEEKRDRVQDIDPYGGIGDIILYKCPNCGNYEERTEERGVY
jgi:predicted RNA-binding Zn-ribbon protein involved in translation (DUF1610 family)